MLDDQNAPPEQADASFIRYDDHMMHVGKLQEIIYYLSEENISESKEKIDRIITTSDYLIEDLARNIIRFSSFNKSKIPLFVRLVSELSKSNEIIVQIENLIDYAIYIKGNYFLIALIDEGFLNVSHRPRLVETSYTGFNQGRIISEEVINYQQIIEDDNIKELKELFVLPNFEIDKEFEFNVSPLIRSNGWMAEAMPLIYFAALCGSISCFRFLLINGACLEKGEMFFNKKNIYRIIYFAIAGGNVEIMTILEQSKILPDPLCYIFAIRFHRIEIFDWLVDQFPESESDYSQECFKSEFIHGINRVKSINPQETFDILCSTNIVYLPKLLITNFPQLNGQKGLCEACETGNTEVVRLIITYLEFNVNCAEVLVQFMMFFLYISRYSTLHCL